MKKWLFAAFAGSLLALGGCSTEVVATRPHDVVYSRPVSPGPDYVWVTGDWVWAGGSYRWREGRWARRRSGYQWHEGYWENHNHGWRWRRGHW
ncbi:MAG TPA: hypothetical protein VGM24_09385 [Puia sp.]|jgi:hypothetical protein